MKMCSCRITRLQKRESDIQCVFEMFGVDFCLKAHGNIFAGAFQKIICQLADLFISVQENGTDVSGGECGELLVSQRIASTD